MAKRQATDSAGTAKVRYVDTEGRWVPGVPADPDIEQEFDIEQAHRLVDTGLYEFVGTAPERPDPEPEVPTDSDGSGQEGNG